MVLATHLFVDPGLGTLLSHMNRRESQRSSTAAAGAVHITTV